MPFTGLRSTHIAAAAAIVVLGGLLLLRGPWSVGAVGSAAPETSSVAMNCAPGQQAIVRQSVVNRALEVNIHCVTASTSIGYTDQFGQPLVQAPNAYAQRAAYAAPIAQPDVRYAPARQSTDVARPVVKKRSWQKTALVIGGSAGAGAGIGALIGGKKGAAIGAAIGGGSAGLFEAIKR